MIIVENNEIEKIDFKEKTDNLILNERPEKKINYFFKIEVPYFKKRIFVFQIKYVLDLLKTISWSVKR